MRPLFADITLMATPSLQLTRAPSVGDDTVQHEIEAKRQATAQRPPENSLPVTRATPAAFRMSNSSPFTWRKKTYQRGNGESTRGVGMIKRHAHLPGEIGHAISRQDIDAKAERRNSHVPQTCGQPRAVPGAPGRPLLDEQG